MFFLLSVLASVAGLLIAWRVASVRGWSFRLRRFAMLLSAFGGMAAAGDATLVFGGGITLRLLLLFVLTLGFQLIVVAGMLFIHYWIAGRAEQGTLR